MRASSLRPVLCASIAAGIALPAAGATLQVGPGQPFATPCAAIAAAHDGDTILIDAAGNYTATCAHGRRTG